MEAPNKRTTGSDNGVTRVIKPPTIKVVKTTPGIARIKMLGRVRQTALKFSWSAASNTGGGTSRARISSGVRLMLSG